jgi:hypothetical protein
MHYIVIISIIITIYKPTKLVKCHMMKSLTDLFALIMQKLYAWTFHFISQPSKYGAEFKLLLVLQCLVIYRIKHVPNYSWIKY